MNKDSKIYTLLASLIIGAFAVFLLYLGRISYIWFDESFTMNMVQHSFGEIIELTALDVHPPLYYFLVKLFTMILGFRTIAFHLPSILCILVLLVESLLFFRKYADKRSAFFVVLGFISMPQIVAYSLELRMYSLCMLLVCSGVYLMYLIWDEVSKEGICKFNLKWLILAVIEVACAYTHYFAAVAAVGSSITFLLCILRKSLNKKKAFFVWICYCGLMFLLYLPWIPVLFRQMGNVNEDYWIGKPSLGELKTYTNEVFQTPYLWLTILLVIMFFSGLFFEVFHAKKEKLAPYYLLCFGTILFWLIFGFGYSLLFSPILVSRYIVMLLPIIWIPLIGSLSKNLCKYALPILGILFCFSFVSNCKETVTDYRTSDQMFLRAYLDSNIDYEKDAFFSFYMQDYSIQAAYYPGVPEYLLEGRDANEVFHSWPKLVPSTRFITEFTELLKVEGNIWCQDGSYLGAFTDAGFSIEEISVGDGILYRIHK